MRDLGVLLFPLKANQGFSKGSVFAKSPPRRGTAGTVPVTDGYEVYNSIVRDHAEAVIAKNTRGTLPLK